jgi:hypothetical protein
MALVTGNAVAMMTALKKSPPGEVSLSINDWRGPSECSGGAERGAATGAVLITSPAIVPRNRDA